jgi:nucleotide-binding universal stress UspA family protein
MRTMLVALDGSAESETILPAAAALAGSGGYEIVLLAVWETAGQEPENDDPRLLDLSARGMRYVEAYLNARRPDLEAIGLRVRAEARTGHPAVEIISAAQDLGADMIAMSTHGRTAAGRRGSIADKVLRGAPVPVLAVGPLVREEAEGPLPIGRILAPLDGSSEAESALPLAIELARSLDARIDLIRVVTPAIGGFGADMGKEYGRELDEARKKVAKAYLDDRRKESGAAGAHVEIGFPHTVIPEYVRRSGADLVVMASHSRYAAGRWTLGGVADTLLEGPAPVVLVRPPLL